MYGLFSFPVVVVGVALLPVVVVALAVVVVGVVLSNFASLAFELRLLLLSSFLPALGSRYLLLYTPLLLLSASFRRLGWSR